MAIAAVFFSFCTVLYFFPVLQKFNAALIGPPEDNMQHFWDIWWAKSVFTGKGLSLSFCKHIFYPGGAPLLYHAYSFYNIFLSFVLLKFMAPPAVYNVLVLLTFPMAGIGAFLLIKYLIRDTRAALIGGFIFSFNHFHVGRALHHIELASIQFIPFFVLYFIRALRGGTKKDLILACVFFLLVSLCSWYYFLFTLYFMGLSYVYLGIRRKKIYVKDVLVKTLIVVGTSFTVLSPWVIRMVIVRFTNPEVEVMWKPFDMNVADLLAFFVPDSYHWAASVPFIKGVNAAFTGNVWEKTAYLGIVNLAIIAVALRKKNRIPVKYFMGFLFFAILSMGAHLHVLGRVTPLALPYEVVRNIPFLSGAASPSRALAYVYLFFAIIAALGVKGLMDMCASRVRKNVIYVSLSALVFFDYFNVYGVTTGVNLPACYGVISRDQDTFAILDLPGDYPSACRYMMYQTMHARPILQGALMRWSGKSLEAALDYNNMDILMGQLKENGVKYIILHRDEFFRYVPKDTAGQQLYSSSLQRQIQKLKDTFTEVYADDRNIVFKIY